MAKALGGLDIFCLCGYVTSICGILHRQVAQKGNNPFAGSIIQWLKHQEC
ncbi:MAG: hypothetical protein ACI4L7_02435 [Christensenellales bacterium]